MHVGFHFKKRSNKAKLVKLLLKTAVAEKYIVWQSVLQSNLQIGKKQLCFILNVFITSIRRMLSQYDGVKYFENPALQV